MAALWGVRVTVLDQDPSGEFLFALLWAGMGTWWCVVDGRMRNAPLPTLASWDILFLAVVAVPLYVIWSRGRRGVWLVLKHGVLMFLTMTVFATIAMLYLGGDLDAIDPQP